MLKLNEVWGSFFYARRLLQDPSQRKHTVQWLFSLRRNYLLNKPSPWMTFDSIAYLRARVRTGWRVFEYGSGGSTLFWLSLGAACVSVEYDAEWYARIQARLKADRSVDYRLVLPEVAKDEEWKDPADPHAYRSSLPEMRHFDFQRYAQQIDEFPDNHFDLVIIDGRVRNSCILHAVPKVRPGGLVVLDNADRPHYLAQTAPLLADFTCIQMYGATPTHYHYEYTNIYLKP
jgi:hypothetical protein